MERLTPKFNITRNENHQYLVDGVVYPSVTQILKEMLQIKFYDHGHDWYRERGTEIDRCTAMICNNTLDWDTVDERIIPHLRQFEQFVKTSRFKLILDHQFVFNGDFGYCGEFDLFGEFSPDRKVLIDVKVGTPMKYYALQTQFYTSAFCLTYPNLTPIITAIERYCLYLNAKYYKLDRHDAIYDLVAQSMICNAYAIKRRYT